MYQKYKLYTATQTLSLSFQLQTLGYYTYKVNHNSNHDIVRLKY